MEITYTEELGDAYKNMRSENLRSILASLTVDFNRLLDRLLYEPDNESIRNRMNAISNRRDLIRNELIRRENESIREITGDGALLRDPTIDPPKVRKMLEQIGNEKVQSLQLVRTPLSKTTQFLLNIASFGQLNKALEKQGIDKFFHLSMIINGKYVLEKNEVINLAKRSGGIPNGSIDLIVPVDGIDITIKQMLDNTKKLMGNLYGSYDAVNNNCGIFLDNVLRANGLGNNNTSEFLNQPTIEVFKSFPKLSELIVKAGTTLGAVANRQLEGEGKQYIYNYQLPLAKISF